MLLSTAATAETGLERFEREVKPQIQLQTFTYKSAEALGDKGFVLHDVVAVMPANPATGEKERTLKIDKVTVEALDFERMKDINDDAPRFAKLKLEGMSGDEETFALLDPYGIPRVPMDIALDYRLDGAAKVFTLNTLEIALRGQGKISLSLVIDGVSDKASEVADARDNGRLRTASLTARRPWPAGQAAAGDRQGAGPEGRGADGARPDLDRGVHRGPGSADAQGARLGGLVHRRLAGARRGRWCWRSRQPRPRRWRTSTRSCSPTRWSTFSASPRAIPGPATEPPKPGRLSSKIHSRSKS